MGIFLLLILPALSLFPQDFGFGGEDEDTPAEKSVPFTLEAGGEISGRLLVYKQVFSGEETFRIKEAGNIFGRLDTAFRSTYLDAFLNLRFDTDKLLNVDEAYARFTLQAFTAEGGLRKLTWGRADSFGPLDIINPLDYSDLTNMGDIKAMKIARPMLHLSWNFDAFSKLEGVFVPWFKAHTFDMAGRWKPSQVETIERFAGISYVDKKEDLAYAQGGIRFSTTWNDIDIGYQYYTGIFQRPAFALNKVMFPPGVIIVIVNDIRYNRFHQFGVDSAFVWLGLNIRAEFGLNLTKDISGDDPEVENPSLVYSVGFDRDLFWGINLNLQMNAKTRLRQDKLYISPTPYSGKLDIETEMDTTGRVRKTSPSSTRITGILSKKLFRDELELKATALWGIGDKDFLVMPAVIWTKNDIRAELAAGFFGGDKTGELGQYRDNAYIKTVLTWSF
ncbi:hypothetical protein AGMMS50230_12670 [Spirochaetia bacterium]|nr:hypothetical protein AGMMS50230_12670 [Spirochaetia bacterium]